MELQQRAVEYNALFKKYDHMRCVTASTTCSVTLKTPRHFSIDVQGVLAGAGRESADTHFMAQGGSPGEDACDRKDLGTKQRRVAGGICQGQPAGQGHAGREPAAPAAC